MWKEPLVRPLSSHLEFIPDPGSDYEAEYIHQVAQVHLGLARADRLDNDKVVPSICARRFSLASAAATADRAARLHSQRRIESNVDGTTPPWSQRFGEERIKTHGSLAILAILVLSPKMDPPDRSDDGSIV